MNCFQISFTYQKHSYTIIFDKLRSDKLYMQLGFVVEYYNHPEATDQFDIVLQLPSILVLILTLHVSDIFMKFGM